MICIECGRAIDDDSKFCRYCGKEVNNAQSVELTNQPEEIEKEERKEDLLKDSRLIGYTFKNWWLIHTSGIVAIGFWTLFFAISIYSLMESNDQFLPWVGLVQIAIYGFLMVGIYGYCLPALKKLYQLRSVGFYDQGGILGGGYGWGLFYGMGFLVTFSMLIIDFSFSDITFWGVAFFTAFLPFIPVIYFCFISQKILSNPEDHLLERREIELD